MHDLVIALQQLTLEWREQARVIQPMTSRDQDLVTGQKLALLACAAAVERLTLSHSDA